MSPLPFTVLVVCTGNICRSALAERIARSHLEIALIDRASVVQVVSAGTRAVVGSAMHPDSALVLEGFGGDAEGFVARQLNTDLVMGADLVLTMTRDHRREVLGIAPRALARTYTLEEASALVRILGDDVELPGQSLPERARALVQAMSKARSRREAGAEDIADPIGRPLDAHQEAGDAIAASLLPILDRIVRLEVNEP